jgi:hypothetical protein
MPTGAKEKALASLNARIMMRTAPGFGDDHWRPYEADRRSMLPVGGRLCPWGTCIGRFRLEIRQWSAEGRSGTVARPPCRRSPFTANPRPWPVDIDRVLHRRTSAQVGSRQGDRTSQVCKASQEVRRDHGLKFFVPEFVPDSTNLGRTQLNALDSAGKKSAANGLLEPFLSPETGIRIPVSGTDLHGGRTALRDLFARGRPQGRDRQRP